jgi:hypothetical protein
MIRAFVIGASGMNGGATTFWVLSSESSTTKRDLRITNADHSQAKVVKWSATLIMHDMLMSKHENLTGQNMHKQELPHPVQKLKLDSGLT